MHRLAIFGAGLVGQSGSGDQTAGRLVRMIKGGQQPPIGLAAMYGLILQRLPPAYSNGNDVFERLAFGKAQAYVCGYEPQSM